METAYIWLYVSFGRNCTDLGLSGPLPVPHIQIEVLQNWEYSSSMVSGCFCVESSKWFSALFGVHVLLYR